jgi:superfamily I DNA/RNA helicase
MAVLQSEAEDSLLIVGPPGSGKTNILMLRANYVRAVGSRQLFITFTRSLAEHLRSGPNVGRADQLQAEEISTFMGWAKSVIYQNGGEVVEETDDFDENRRLVVNKITSIVEENSISQLYDTAFVDEVQDFWESELKVIFALSKRVNFAGDSRQRIWKSREGLSVAAGMADETVKLEKHYRIGANICEYADKILPPKVDQAPLIEGCNYPERVRPSSIDVTACATVEEMVTFCAEKVKEQLRYINEEPIGVIGPSHAALDAFMELVRNDPVLAGITVRQKSDDYHAYDANSRVRVMTIYSAKGSEFRSVHLLNADTFQTWNKELAFTGVTRAKTEVSVYYTSQLRGHMMPPDKGELTTDISSIF